MRGPAHLRRRAYSLSAVRLGAVTTRPLEMRLRQRLEHVRDRGRMSLVRNAMARDAVPVLSPVVTPRGLVRGRPGKVALHSPTQRILDSDEVDALAPPSLACPPVTSERKNPGRHHRSAASP